MSRGSEESSGAFQSKNITVTYELKRLKALVKIHCSACLIDFPNLGFQAGSKSVTMQSIPVALLEIKIVLFLFQRLRA